MNVLAGKISDSELEIMKVLWSAGKAVNLTELRHALSQESSWDASTIKTLLRRLCQKGVVRQQKKDVFYYSSAVSRQEYHEYSTRSLADKLYGGSVRQMVASMVDSGELSQQDFEELQAMFKGVKHDA